MKIAFVCSYFEGPELDTITTSFYEELVKAQRHDGNELIVISLTDGEPSDVERFGVRFVSRKFDRERYTALAGIEFAPALAWNLSRAMDLYRQGAAVARSVNAELIQCVKAIDAVGWLAYENMPVAVFSVTPQFEIMRLDFDKQYTRFDTELVTMLEVMAMSVATVVASPSRALRHIIATTSGLDVEKIAEYMVPFAKCPDQDSGQEMDSHASTPDRLKIVYLGGLERYKGIDVLVESLLPLSKNAPPFRVVIAGEGPQLMGLAPLVEVLKERLSELGLADRVDFLPPQPRHARRQLVRTADVVVFPFRYCGCMSHVLEAMSDGAAVIATEVGSIGERLTHTQNAFLVPADDPAALAEGLEQVLMDRELRNRLRMGARGFIDREYGDNQALNTIVKVTGRALTEFDRTASSATRCAVAHILAAADDFCDRRYVSKALEDKYTEGAARAWSQAYQAGRSEAMSEAQGRGLADLFKKWLHAGRR